MTSFTSISLFVPAAICLLISEQTNNPHCFAIFHILWHFGAFGAVYFVE